MDKETQNSRGKKITIETAIIVAIIAFIGSFLGSLLDGYNQLTRQQREFESTLIIRAVETGSSEVSKNNLQFLIDANLLTDKAQQIRLKKIIRDSTYIINRGISETSTVYICNHSNATKYHLSRNCRLLKNCQAEILEVSRSAAEKQYQRNICAFEN